MPAGIERCQVPERHVHQNQKRASSQQDAKPSVLSNGQEGSEHSDDDYPAQRHKCMHGDPLR